MCVVERTHVLSLLCALAQLPDQEGVPQDERQRRALWTRRDFGGVRDTHVLTHQRGRPGRGVLGHPSAVGEPALRAPAVGAAVVAGALRGRLGTHDFVEDRSADVESRNSPQALGTLCGH